METRLIVASRFIGRWQHEQFGMPDASREGVSGVTVPSLRTRPDKNATRSRVAFAAGWEKPK